MLIEKREGNMGIVYVVVSPHANAILGLNGTFLDIIDVMLYDVSSGKTCVGASKDASNPFIFIFVVKSPHTHNMHGRYEAASMQPFSSLFFSAV